MFGRVEKEEFENYKSKVGTEFLSIKNEINQLKGSFHSSLDALNTEIKSTSTVSDEVARQAAANAVESEKNVKNIERLFTSALDELNSMKQEVDKLFSSVTNIESKVVNSENTISDIVAEAQKDLSELNEKKSAVEAEYALVSERAIEFNSYLEQSKDLPSSLEATKGLMADGKKLVDSMQSLLTHALKRKGEIDELYNDIYGEDISNAEGETEHTSGKKDELDVAYIGLQSDISKLRGTVDKAIDSINLSFHDLHTKNTSDFENLLSESISRFKAVDEQLTGLLPGAMAAGLSAAYEEKKGEEIESLKSFDNAFRWAIGGMVAISCIPLLIDVYLIFWKDLDLLKVLKDTPTLLFAILPLYFPVLWLAYSSNKKSNLSKRLIEEYTHKSVLGKTYSGLANQIENLQQHGDVKAELRTKLLFNVLQVSAENPGKLITNYSKSDHPLMDALENSARLADSVSALAKIPGFSAIAAKLAAKADKLLEENTEKVRRGVDAHEELENDKKKKAESESENEDEDDNDKKKAA
jgi:hypothetical protein